MAEHPNEPANDLERLIADARQARPDATAEARITAGVARAVGGAAPVGLGRRSLVAGTAKVIVVAAALGGALWWALRPAPMPSVPASPTTVPGRTPAVVESPPQAEAVPPPPVAPAPHAPPASRSAPRRVGPKANAENARAATQPAEAPPSEWQLVRQAREALVSDPDASLRLTDEHARRYPHGALAQEREVIAVDALVRLGRRDDAKARADVLLRRFPQTAHRAHIESLLARPAP